jgi:hypothetical protein
MIALKTMFYNPSDFASMDNPASMAMTDRMNGIFAALEIPPRNLPLPMNLPLVSTLRRITKGSRTCRGRSPSATSRNNFLRSLFRLKKAQLVASIWKRRLLASSSFPH